MNTDTGCVWILMTSAITHDTDTGCVWILMTSAITHEHRLWLCMDTNDHMKVQTTVVHIS